MIQGRCGLVAGCVLLLGCYTGLNPDGRGATGASGGTEGGSEGSAGESGSDEGPEVEPGCGEELKVGAARMRLLTRYEYDNTIFALLGDDSQPAQTFPPENQSTAFENNAEDHQVDKDSVRRYMEVAEDVAGNAVADLSAILPCDPAVDLEEPCGDAFIGTFGRRAFRRPLSEDERVLFHDLFASELAAHGFTQAIATVIQAMLQSPQFLYRIELVPEGAEPGDVVAISDSEMASRLSYFLAATTPDDALLDAAEAGELRTAAQIEDHARRLLESEGARLSVRHFHRQWLALSALESVTKDPTLYPGLELSTAPKDWSQSVQDFVEHVVFEGEGTLDELLSSDRVFLSPSMAAFYEGQPAEGGGYTLPGKRAGLVTQPALMALLAYPDRSSPVARGVFTRERLLCQKLPPPPDDVDIEPPDPDPNATTRERFDQHTENVTCAACHVLIDPLGFTYEHYDAVGRWRTEENGLPIDASGEVIGATDDDLVGPVDDAIQLANRLAKSEDFQECATTQWLTFALGRTPDAEADRCTLQTTLEAAASGDIRELLVAIVLSDAFRHRVVDGGAP
jgi:hypothetical protein